MAKHINDTTDKELQDQQVNRQEINYLEIKGQERAEESGQSYAERCQKEAKQYQKMYDTIMNYEIEIHKRNQHRIKIGLRCIYIIPAIFLLLLLFTDSSKIVFLILWIASLFGIAIYLIGVEYGDYQLQHKIHEIKGEGEMKLNSLIEIEDMEAKVLQAMEKLEEARGGKLE